MPTSQAVLAIQQPEVHLHPKAQAELGSLFASVAAEKKGSSMVVETHSDYLIDRVRLEVAHGTIAPEDISLLFFDKPHAVTKIHHLGLDSLGNITNAPRSYRSFFLREQLNVLGRGGR